MPSLEQGPDPTPVQGFQTNEQKGVRGVKGALVALGKESCYKAFGFDKATQATELLNTHPIVDVDLGFIWISDEINRVTWGQAGRSGPISLNSNRSISGDLRRAGSSQNIDILSVYERKYGLKEGSLDTDTWWAITIIHELGHVTGKANADADDEGQSFANTLGVIQGCFGQLRK